MRIAQVAPLTSTISATQHGPARAIAYLVDELVRQGHDVTLFATADSQTAARLVPAVVAPIQPIWPDWVVEHVMMLEQAYAPGQQFDLIHNHLDAISAPLARRHAGPTLTTIHYPLDAAQWLGPIYAEYRDLPLIAIADRQRAAPWDTLSWFGTVPPGLPRDLYRLQPGPGRYLALLDAAAPTAIEEASAIAARAGLALKLGRRGAIDGADAAAEPTAPIEIVTLDDDRATEAFLGDAVALVVAADEADAGIWAMIEALACGTPVLAHEQSWAGPLLAQDQVGATFATVEQAAAGIETLRRLDRQRCRDTFEARFTSSHMAHAYLDLYEQLCLKPSA